MLPNIKRALLFRKYYKIGLGSKVLPAGIIIGRGNRLARVAGHDAGDMELDQFALAQHSHTVREHFLYYPSGIRLKTWDWVLDSLRRYAASSELLLKQRAGR